MTPMTLGRLVAEKRAQQQPDLSTLHPGRTFRPEKLFPANTPPMRQLGKQLPNVKKIYNVFRSQPEGQAYRFRAGTHGRKGKFLTSVVDQLRARGYKPQYEAGAELMREMVHERPPMIGGGARGIGFMSAGPPGLIRYDPDIKATLGNWLKRGPTSKRRRFAQYVPAFTLPGGIVHEYEHLRQMPYNIPGYSREKVIGPEDYDEHAARAALETPPTIGNVMFMGELARRQLKKPLNTNVTYPSGYTQRLGWMLRQARKHGYFGGRSMTDLLATPEGQSYLRTIMKKR